MIEMEVGGISVDPQSGGAVLVLKGDRERSLAIAIGLPEATAIAKELEGTKLPRPLTHDLLRSVLEELGGSLEQIEIVALRDNTYFAELVVRVDGRQTKRIDSRPSDAIALAVRTRSPIFVHRQVLEQADPDATGSMPETQEDWKKLLEEMDPADFGKYKM